MLELKVYDDDEEVVLQFEHSLLSLSKWESKHKKPFASTPTKTSLEMIDYYEDMLLSPAGRSHLVYSLTPEQLDTISDYINDPMTASSVPDEGSSRPSGETVTSELIYYWMSALKINWAAETWHLSRLMMLIRIANYKQQPEKKRNPSEMMRRWRDMNAKNKEMFNTDG